MKPDNMHSLRHLSHPPVKPRDTRHDIPDICKVKKQAEKTLQPLPPPLSFLYTFFIHKETKTGHKLNLKKKKSSLHVNFKYSALVN